MGTLQCEIVLNYDILFMGYRLAHIYYLMLTYLLFNVNAELSRLAYRELYLVIICPNFNVLRPLLCTLTLDLWAHIEGNVYIALQVSNAT